MKVLLLALLLGVSAPARAQLKQEYDRFADRTELWAPSMDVVMRDVDKGQIGVHAFTNYPGRRLKARPPYVAIAFRLISRDGWKFLECHTVDLLADGTRIPLPEGKHTGRSLNSSQVFESVLVSVPWTTFETIANAKRLEFRICNSEVAITDARLKDWRSLVVAATPH